MEKFNLNDVCCFDCETTGVPDKGMKWDEDFFAIPAPGYNGMGFRRYRTT